MVSVLGATGTGKLELHNSHVPVLVKKRTDLVHSDVVTLRLVLVHFHGQIRDVQRLGYVSVHHVLGERNHSGDGHLCLVDHQRVSQFLGGLDHHGGFLAVLLDGVESKQGIDGNRFVIGGHEELSNEDVLADVGVGEEKLQAFLHVCHGLEVFFRKGGSIGLDGWIFRFFCRGRGRCRCRSGGLGGFVGFGFGFFCHYGFCTVRC
mmetsp:Transcript_27568/g.75220  ORF Transcript_27568/g.75220 Transcript_27568/m.75220 type:complete len:205 (-) Transcript_27568:261-875(-)